MNSQHRSAIIGILVAIAAVGGMYVLWPGTAVAPDDTEKEEDSSTQITKEMKDTAEKIETPATKNKTPATPTTTTKPVTQGGSYETYTPAAIGYAALGEVVLFFYSPSCPACVNLDKDIVTNMTRIPKDVKILKVDFDSASDVKTKYGVTEPHRFIQVNSAGDRVTQWGLSSTLSDLVTRIVRY